MAIIRTSQKRTASILVDNGVSSSGKELTKAVSYSNINPAATPAQVLAAMQALGSLMNDTVRNYIVTDKDLIVEE